MFGPAKAIMGAAERWTAFTMAHIVPSSRVCVRTRCAVRHIRRKEKPRLHIILRWQDTYEHMHFLSVASEETSKTKENYLFWGNKRRRSLLRG